MPWRIGNMTETNWKNSKIIMMVFVTYDVPDRYWEDQGRN